MSDVNDTRPFDDEWYEAQQTFEEDQWLQYWNGLTPEEQARERQMMDDYSKENNAQR